MAEMSQKKFEAERRGGQLVDGTMVIPDIHDQSSFARDGGVINKFLNEENIRNPQYKPLKIPRRPQWTKEMSAQEINHNENLAFLEWRRDIASIEENNVKLAITPFEKNIEVWKQLWRVIEKSDVLLQIVDARNPFFFYSEDLEKYIQEKGGEKEFILCINKADYLSEELIAHWNKYFNDKGVTHIFFSAKMEQDKLDHESEEEEDTSEDELMEAKKEEEKTFQPMFDEFKKEIEEEKEVKKEEPEEKLEFNTQGIFSRKQLLDILEQKAKAKGRSFEEKLNVGTVGYPNVGKSSLINVICGRKRVGVAAMPGKTKHFQTLDLDFGDRDICLVDCPGLVFPSFANSKAEMYCCGVLPIHTIRDYISPVSLIMSRVPKEVLQAYYKIQLPARNHPRYTSMTLLCMIALKKGWITGSNNPNTAQCSRHVLTDYTTGQLVFCHLRPDYEME